MKKILLILAIALVWSANAEAMVVQHNMQKLSSGYRINRAMDLRLARVGGCIKPSAEQVASVVSDDANNTYSATYGNKAPRVATGGGNCESLGTNANILAQAAQSMLAQANQSNQGVLSLLQ